LGASLAGAFPVVAVDLYDHKLEKARELGVQVLDKSEFLQLLGIPEGKV
jgi:threonine dehydrogenase-like Zn-dependent dehydrogenase